MGEANTLEVRGLLKSFAKFTLGPLDLTMPQGSVYGLIGPNGAGKTTIINLIMGMGEKNEGSIRVFGMDHLDHEVAVKKRIGYVSPDMVLTGWKTVRRLIEFVRPFYADWDDEHCQNLMSRLGIGWDDKTMSLSYGNATKLRLILALSHKPDLLLLDEPLAGLDPLARQEVFTEILSAVQDETRSVLMSSHDLHDLERIADYIGFLNKGQMILEGATTDIIARYTLLDLTGGNGALSGLPGAHVISQNNGRQRVLLDVSLSSIELTAQQGVSINATAPVTLNDLFIMLVKGGEDAR